MNCKNISENEIFKITKKVRKGAKIVKSIFENDVEQIKTNIIKDCMKESKTKFSKYITKEIKKKDTLKNILKKDHIYDIE